jgi:hypothetical protein
MSITEYYVPIKVITPSQEGAIQSALQGYPIFTTASGDLNQTCFSRENLPFVGEMIVIKTRSRLAAKTAQESLSGIEGLLVLPLTEKTLDE